MKRRRGIPPKKPEPIKKVGRGRIQDRQHLTPREESYCQMLSHGVTMEAACLELNMTIKEASRLHAEHPLLTKRINELKGERTDAAIDETINQHITLLTTINDQINKKIENGEAVSVRELKDSYELSQAIGPMLTQHGFRQEQGQQKRIAEGNCIVLEGEDLTIMELQELVDSPKYRDLWREQNEKTFVRWFKGIEPHRRRRILAQIQPS